MLKVFFLLFLILKKEEEGVFSSLVQQIHQKLKERVSNQKAFMATQCDSILQEKKYEKKLVWIFTVWGVGSAGWAYPLLCRGRRINGVRDSHCAQDGE